MEPMTMALISGGLQAATGAIQAGIGQSAARQKYASDLAFPERKQPFLCLAGRF